MYNTKKYLKGIRNRKNVLDVPKLDLLVRADLRDIRCRLRQLKLPRGPHQLSGQLSWIYFEVEKLSESATTTTQYEQLSEIRGLIIDEISYLQDALDFLKEHYFSYNQLGNARLRQEGLILLESDPGAEHPQITSYIYTAKQEEGEFSPPLYRVSTKKFDQTPACEDDLFSLEAAGSKKFAGRAFSTIYVSDVEFEISNSSLVALIEDSVADALSSKTRLKSDKREIPLRIPKD